MGSHGKAWSRGIPNYEIIYISQSSSGCYEGNKGAKRGSRKSQWEAWARFLVSVREAWIGVEQWDEGEIDRHVECILENQQGSCRVRWRRSKVQLFLSLSFYRQENQSPEQLGNLPKDTQLEHMKTEFKPRVSVSKSLLLFSPQCIVSSKVYFRGQTVLIN